MNCASCGEPNRAGARFCGGCGQALAARCPSCGVEVEPGRRFCDACGASLVAPEAAAPEARKVVTIVFADLIGSTALHERLDAESARRLMDRYHRSMGAVVEAHGGTVMQLLGDGVLAGFGVPRVAEDDAIRAVRAAVGMQHAFRELAREQAGLAGEIGLRVAVYTGEVVAGDDHTHVMGDPVNVAARLQQEARDGDVLLGESTQRLVAEKVTLAPFGSFALKGRAEAVAAYRVVSLERPAGAPAIAFVGREDELRRIRAVYDTAVAKRAARLAVILGSPGLGKSRLIDEFTRRLGDGATVLMAHCDAAGGATFAPLAEALRGLLRIDDGAGGDALRAAILSALPEGESERARIADGVAALVAGTPASPEEIFFVVRRGLAALATQRSVVLAIDDIQWAEPLLLDLIEHLVQWGSDVPLLVLAAARPELRDTRSSLATTGGLVSDVVTLAGLDAGAATRLAANVIGAEALPAAIAGRVLATSEGNPLFVGELVRMLVHDGALKLEGDRWTAAVEVADLEMPPTIHALLAARIERLRPEERAVLERAAVIGRHFSRAALAQLLPREITDLDARLESLRRSELVEPDTGWFLGEPVLRFHHVLIRDAAYRRLLKNTRAELHGRFADWLEARAAGSVEHDETLGWHLEQAHQLLLELGPIDTQGRALGERAARHLASAGRRALARDDLTPAASLLERALARLDAADPARADLTLDWCEALLSAGDVGTAVRAIAELGRFTLDSDRLRAWHTCFTGQLAVLTDPKALRASAEAVEAAAATLTSAGDAAGEAKAHSVHALVLAQLGKIGACEAALDKALAAARRAHDRRRANAVLAGAPVAALWGPSPVTRASGRCLDVVRVLRITQGAPAVEAVALRCQAVLETLRGRAEAARRMIASSRRMVEELGITQRVLEADLFAGLIELLEGDAAAAERFLRVAYDGLRAQGLGIDAAQAAALLGRALLAQGRIAEAEAISVESESLAGDSFKAAIAWRGVRAEALAARGEHASAVEFARAAVEIAAATDDLLDHADARQALAVALRAAGRSAEAGAEEKRAIELWDAKGATLLAERARRGAARITELSRSPGPSAAPPQATRRRVRPNAATTATERLGAAFAAKDASALAGLFADDYDSVEHPTGTVVGREGLLHSLHALLRSSGPSFRYEHLATLGESLALQRRWWSSEATSAPPFDVAASEREGVGVCEVDERGRFSRGEYFAAESLGDAVTRLYERYAERLPNGPERTRAAATAHSVAVVLGPYDLDRFATAWEPGIAYVDHRVEGIGPLSGAQTAQHWLRSLLEVAENVENRLDDVLTLRAEAFLLRLTNFGTERASGGYYERAMLWLGLFGAEGLLARSEWFAPDRDKEALARFAELTAAAPPVQLAAAPSRAVEARERRVRPNAATAHAAREDAAFAARDGDAIATLYADAVEVVDHPNGATHDKPEYLASLRRILRAQDLTRRHEPLATLGDALALCRMSLSAGGIARGNFDVGAYEYEGIVLYEVDAQARCRRAEFYAPDRVGVAVARLYERYAELLPDGPERIRAAATARSVAVLLGPFDPDRYATVWAPGIAYDDHRVQGIGPLSGAPMALQWLRSLLEVAENIGNRFEDVLGLRSDALLLRWTNFGTERAGGGSYERQFLWLGVFGTDGFLTHLELFEGGRDAEALARFDALTAERARSARRVRPNAATTHTACLDAAIAARDPDALPALFADESEAVDHTTGTAWDRQGLLASWRSLLRSRDPTARHEPLATLGDSLALGSTSTSASGFVGRTFDVGAHEREEVHLIEVDAQGRRRRSENFAADRLGDAVARLYERYAELLSDGPERTRAAATARSVAAHMGPHDLARYARAIGPAIEFADHRSMGFESVRGADGMLRVLGTISEVAHDVANRVDDVLDLRSDAYLLRWTSYGTDRAGGGAFERCLLVLLVFGTDGLVTRWELFGADRETEALARFDELTAEPTKSARRVRANAATANAARYAAAVAARDEGAFLSLYADDLDAVHHPTGFTYDRRGALATSHALLRAPDLTFANEPLATLGASLALCRVSWAASAAPGRRFDVGPYENERILLVEVDSQGRRLREESFAPDRLGDAIARLYERYADLLADGPERTRAAATARSVAAEVGPMDPDRYAAALAPAIECLDHRTLGTWSARGAEAFLKHFRSLLEVADGFATREDDILGLRSDACLVLRTHFGRERAGGGAYERSFLWLGVFGRDGLLTRIELFEADHDVEALVRIDELTAEPPRSERRVRPNAATEHAARLCAAIATRDEGSFSALVCDDTEVVHHTTQSVYGRAELLRVWRSLIETRDGTFSIEPLATVGESLALSRQWIAATGAAGKTFDVGAYEIENISLFEVDEQGRRRHSEYFADDRLGDAVARLYQRYADLLPDGPERSRAAATARSVAALSGPISDVRWATALAPAIEVVDRRILATFSASGAEALLQGVRSWLEVGVDPTMSVDDVLRLESSALLSRRTHAGTDRVSGGAYEREFIQLLLFGTDGLVTRFELFDLGHEAAALARFDELTGEPPPERFANAAWRTMQRFERCWSEGDWHGVIATLAPTHRTDDRRRLMRVQLSTTESFASLRFVFELSESRWHNELLATRGERLVLFWVRITGQTAESGPMSEEHLQVVEVDAEGRQAAIVAFDLDDLDAAYAKLDQRFSAGEAAPYADTWQATQRLSRVLSARDWEQWPSVFTQDFVLQDHRLLGWGTRSRDEFLVQTRAMAELAPDFRLRGDHSLAINRRGLLSVGGWVGSREGGPFEIQVLSVMVLGPDHRLQRLHTYDLEQVAAAHACFEALTAEPPARCIENAATRAADRLGAAWQAHDWKRAEEFFPAGFRYFDRKRTTQMGELDRDRYLEWMRPLFGMSSSRLVQEVLATRGDRLALTRIRVEVADHDIGPTEIESVGILEVDERGERVATVRFDPEDLAAAYAELDTRYHAGEAAPHARVSAGMREFKRAFAERDWDALAARCAPDIVVHDHRLLGWETLHGPAAYVEALRLLVELAPDTRLRIDHSTIRENGYLVLTVWEGTREGGAYEAPSLMIAELDTLGRIRRFDQYDLERLDQAQARFAELRPDPLRIPPNAAMRASDRNQQVLEAHDWDALARLTAPTMVMDDRRRGIRISGDRDTYLASTRMVASTARMCRTLLATAGDRLALQRVLWTGEVDGGAFESEILSILEIDADDRIVAIIAFDPDDRRAASAELLARDPHSDAVKRAMGDHDLDRLRAALPDDFVLNDHRRTGLGQLGKDEYITSLAALFEQAPDVIIEPLYTVAAAEHANLSVVPMYGTLAGGGAFESVMLRLASLRSGQIAGLELFEPEDLGAARARFEALRPDPLRIPPNAATRAGDRWVECIAAGDWEALRALCAPIVFEDRRRFNRITGDCDMVVAQSQVIAELGGRASRSVLASSGDRLALERVLWTADDQGAASEVETLQIMEVDAEGRVVASIIFDPDDRRAASAELLDRDPHSDAVKRAMGDHDLDQLRAALPADFVFHDHRRTGLGKLESADDYIAALAVLVEQAPDVMMETLYTVAVGKHGNVSTVRRFGTLADGGAFESVFVRLASFRGERIVEVEMFELEDLDAALARFEALRS